jgi:hypothetical protein
MVSYNFNLQVVVGALAVLLVVLPVPLELQVVQLGDISKTCQLDVE